MIYVLSLSIELLIILMWLKLVCWNLLVIIDDFNVALFAEPLAKRIENWRYIIICLNSLWVLRRLCCKGIFAQRKPSLFAPMKLWNCRNGFFASITSSHYGVGFNDFYYHLKFAQYSFEICYPRYIQVT